MHPNYFQNLTHELLEYEGKMECDEGNFYGLYLMASGLYDAIVELESDIKCGADEENIAKRAAPVLTYISQCAMELEAPLSYFWFKGERNHNLGTENIFPYMMIATGIFKGIIKGELINKGGPWNRDLHEKMCSHLRSILWALFELLDNNLINIEHVMQIAVDEEFDKY